MSSELAIGIDFGGTSVKSGVILGGEVVDAAPPLATPEFDGPDPLVEALLETIQRLRDRGHDIEVSEPWAAGRLSAASRRPDGLLKSAATPRLMQAYAVGR